MAPIDHGRMLSYVELNLEFQKEGRMLSYVELNLEFQKEGRMLSYVKLNLEFQKEGRMLSYVENKNNNLSHDHDVGVVVFQLSYFASKYQQQSTYSGF